MNKGNCEKMSELCRIQTVVVHVSADSENSGLLFYFWIIVFDNFSPFFVVIGGSYTKPCSRLLCIL